jgi:hypothetical protein
VQSFSAYEEARKGLDGLIEGTKEYEEALINANNAALELMENNPGMFQEGVHYDWIDGKIEFKEGALEAA